MAMENEEPPNDPAPAAAQDHAAGTDVLPGRVASYRFTAQPIYAAAPEAETGVSTHTVSGAIDAADATAAQASLASMGLRVLSLEPAEETGRPRAVKGSSFLAFNQQLAYLTEAGLPMEQGLRLIAQDMKRGGLAVTIQQVADELQAGKGLAEAFATHRGAFPPLYGAVLESGVRTGNLPAVLLGLGRHLELLQRLRAAVWRAVAYPLVVFFGVLLMLGILGAVVVPQFREIFEDFDTDVPALTKLVLTVSQYMPAIVIALVVFAVLLFAGMALMRAGGKGQVLLDLLLRVPLIGPAIRFNMLGRWCDALRLGLHAGLDLPAALGMAADTLRSGPLDADTRLMIQTVEAGQSIRQNVRLRFVPQAVPAAIELAAHADDLPGMLENLAAMYQQQAEARVAALQTVLGPLMLVLVALIIGVVVTAMFLPLVRVMQSVM